eukprot:6463276-Alexandrium_andersonii.AAC.1
MAAGLRPARMSAAMSLSGGLQGLFRKAPVPERNQDLTGGLARHHKRAQHSIVRSLSLIHISEPTRLALI